MIDINKLVKSINSLSFITVTNQNIEHVMPYLDLTLLTENYNDDVLDKLIDDANRFQVAACCIQINALPHVVGKLAHSAVATVINFPSGNGTRDKIMEQLNYAKSGGANEIDFVFPYQSYLSGDKTNALETLERVAIFCKSQQLLLKVIIETGEFDSLEHIYQVAKDIIQYSPQFLKTSTGTTPHGASFESVFALASAINESNKPIGIKVSGGIKTSLQAIQYMHMVKSLFNVDTLTKDLFRIGASSLLADLMSQMHHNKS
jgi:deoxyribose-phosphate aldolase